MEYADFENFETLKCFIYGWMGWMDGMGYQKCPSTFFILWVYIDHIYITSYICSQNFSPTSLWVSKFDVKLGVMIKIFKIKAGR